MAMQTSNGSSSGADFSFDASTFQPGLGHGTDVAAAPLPAAPGKPSAFAAGLNELVDDPVSFFKDLIPGVQGSYVPPAGATVGGAVSNAVDQFANAPANIIDYVANAAKGALPSYNQTLVLAGVAVVGLLAVAYIAHKAL